MIIENRIVLTVQFNSTGRLWNRVRIDIAFNSIKFVPRDGEISIGARKENGRVRIEIKDNGVGMNDEKVREILGSDDLDPSTGTEGEKGSGIGLNLCKEFIRQHGGQLEIQSEVGRGTSFIITLPIGGLSSRPKDLQTD